MKGSQLITTIQKHFRPAVRGLTAAALIAVMVFTAAPTAFALTAAERKHYANIGIEFIDDPCDENPGGEIKLVGEDNIEKAFRYFINQKLTPEQAAGILGNLRQESGVNPASHNTAAQPSGIDPGSIIPGETWHGGGIAQWEGGRWTGPGGLLNYVAGKGDFKTKQGDGKNWKDLGIQLNFIWHEMPSQRAFGKLGELKQVLPQATEDTNTLEALKMSKDVETATYAFELTYERAGDPRMENRVRYAKEVLAMAKAKNWITVMEDGSAVSSACGGLAEGRVNTDGYAFPMAPQKRKNYGGLPCNASPRSYTTDEEHGSVTFRNVVTCHHDDTPAFDLMDGKGGSAVYALTDGKILRVRKDYSIVRGGSVPGCHSITFQAQNKQANDETYYWYGHLMQSTVNAGQTVKAGQQIARTASEPQFDSRCFGGGPHLHIDRGCIINGKAYPGGNDGCRDPAFMDDLKKIWEGLPA